MDWQSTGETLAKWVAGGLGAIGAAAALRSRLSKDKLTVTQNDGNSEWIVTVVRERDEALSREREMFQALQRVNSDLKEVALKLVLAQEQISRMKSRNRRLEAIVADDHPELAGWLTTEPGDLPDAPEIEIPRNRKDR